MSDPHFKQRTIHPEVKIISEADGTVDYIASDESCDSYREIISAKGWRFTRFKKNAPFVDSHDYWTIQKLLGEVTSFKIVNGQLVERVRWAKDIEENKLAQLGWKMTMGGFLKAVSVGFFPVRWAYNGGDGWTEAIKLIGLTPKKAENIQCIYLEQEQIELSACIIGANPNALAKSLQEGCIGDADLASVGFQDSDMQFLKDVTPALEKPDLDPVLRAVIQREIASITGGKRQLSGQPPKEPGNSPGMRGGGEIAERRASERSAFLKRLNAVVQ